MTAHTGRPLNSFLVINCKPKMFTLDEKIPTADEMRDQGFRIDERQIKLNRCWADRPIGFQIHQAI